MKRRSWMSFITRHALALQWLEIIFDLLSRSNDPNYLQISYGWPQPQPADLGCCSHHRMGATLKHMKDDISYLVPDKCEVSNTGHRSNTTPPPPKWALSTFSRKYFYSIFITNPVGASEASEELNQNWWRVWGIQKQPSLDQTSR